MDVEEQLDKVFSIWTRIRFADWKGFVHCYTCPEVFHWKELDCGHWLSRQHQAVRWDKNNARPQCKECNQGLGGLPEVFEEELREEIGDDAVDELELRAMKTKYLDDAEKESLLINLKKLVNTMQDGII